MKTKKQNPFLIAAITLAGFAFTATTAHALTWDTVDNGAAIDPGSGDWNTTTANWNGSPNVVWSQTSATVGTQAAVFAGSDGAVDAYAINLTEAVAATTLTFSNTGYKLTGSTLTTTGIITVASGKTATINAALTNNATNAITGTLNLGGGGTLSTNSFWAGAGTLNITGGTYTATNPRFTAAITNQTAGTINMASTTTTGLGYAAGRNTSYTISGTGIMNANATSAGGITLGRQMGGAFTATLTVQSGGTVNVGTTSFGSFNAGAGTSDYASNHLIDVQGGTFNVGSGNAANTLSLFGGQGANAGKTSTYQQSGGTATINAIRFGNGVGTYDATALATVKLSGGNLYVGQGGITLSANAATLPYAIQLQGGTLGASAAWSSSLNMKLTAATIRAQDSGSNARNITLSGNLTDDTAVTGTLTKTGTGILTLTGTNNYSGDTTITTGILSFGNKAAKTAATATAGAAGSVGLGVKDSDAAYYSATDVGDLFNTTLTGFSLDAASGVAIDTTNAGGSFDQTVALTAGRSLTKIGTGTLVLSQTNTYTGQTFISAGTLQLSNTSAVSGSSLISVGANTLQIATDTAFAQGSGTSLSIAVGTIVSDRATAGAGLTHAFAGNLAVSHATQNFTAGTNVTSGTAAIQVASMNCASGSGGTATLNPVGVNLIITGNATGANTGTSTFALGGTSTGNSIGGVIENGTRTTQNLTKSNTSIWTLSGANTYSGATTITGGTLTLGAIGVLPDATPVSIGAAILDAATSGTEIAGTLDATAAATINLGTGAKLEFADSSGIDWTGGTLNITGTFGATSIRFGTDGSGLLPAQLALISVNGSGAGTYTLNGLGYLTGGVVNNPPTISDVTNQSVPSGGNTGALAFTITDEDVNTVTPTGTSSNLTLVPNANITFSGSGANRTVTVTPVSGLSGTATITVTLTDNGSLTAQDTFTLTVTDNFLSWATANGVTGGANGDSDNDGVKNLVEYSLVNGGERGVLSGNTITFTKRGAPYGSDITYDIETSIDLFVWGTPGSGVTQSSSLISYLFTPSTPVKNFARLRVTQIP